MFSPPFIFDLFWKFFSHLEASSALIHPGDHTGVVAGVVQQIPDKHVQRRQRQLGRVLPGPASLPLARARPRDLGPGLRVPGLAGGGRGHLHRGLRGRGPRYRARGRGGDWADVRPGPQQAGQPPGGLIPWLATFCFLSPKQIYIFNFCCKVVLTAPLNYRVNRGLMIWIIDEAAPSLNYYFTGVVRRNHG